MMNLFKVIHKTRMVIPDIRLMIPKKRFLKRLSHRWPNVNVRGPLKNALDMDNINYNSVWKMYINCSCKL